MFVPLSLQILTAQRILYEKQKCTLDLPLEGNFFQQERLETKSRGPHSSLPQTSEKKKEHGMDWKEFFNSTKTLDEESDDEGDESPVEEIEEEEEEEDPDPYGEEDEEQDQSAEIEEEKIVEEEEEEEEELEEEIQRNPQVTLDLDSDPDIEEEKEKEKEISQRVKHGPPKDCRSSKKKTPSNRARKRKKN
jgi:hypothetical protein